jgi:hypothetical protein
MPLALVQELDAAFRFIPISKDYFLKVNKLEKILQKLEELDNAPRERPDQGSLETIKGVEEDYREAVKTIHGFCLVPMFTAIIMRLLDLLLGPTLQWKHVAAFLTILIVYHVVRKRSPISPAIIVIVLAIMPSRISGTLTRLGSSFFWFDSVCSPLVLYAQENISDRIEVRWVLIGMGLYNVYWITELAVTSTNSIILILLIGFVGILISNSIIVLIYDGGWWDPNFKLSPTPEVVPERAIQHWIAHLVESQARFRVQEYVFLLNRIVRSSIPLLRQLSRLVPYWSGGKPDATLPYQYSELSANTIRLLRIQRGRAFEVVKCRFEEVPITHPGDYEAVSYVWGTDSEERLIFIDGRPMAITRSAFDIIRRRRSMMFEQVIWIDQVCINQSNKKEKSSQIVMMKDIYREAQRVMAFLGPASDARLVQSHITELHYRSSGMGFSAEVLREIYNTEPKKGRQWNALADFLGNPWFRRVWIIQEATFAKTLCLFYGDVCIDWEYLSRATAVLNDQHVLGAFPPSDGSLFTDARQNSLTGLSNIQTMLTFRGDVKSERQITLGLVLRSCTSFDATDPRDKVYAVLGLAKDNSEDAFEADYNDANLPRFVYTKAMRYLLSQSVDPLSCVADTGIGLERLINDLPSWVPDWSHSTHTRILDARYKAGTWYEPVIGFDPDNEFIVHFDGEEFDQVKHLGETQRREPNWTSSENTSYMKKWFSDAEALAKEHASDPYPIGSSFESVLEAFIRTIIGNHSDDYDGCLSTEEGKRGYDAMQRNFAATESLVLLETLISLSNIMSTTLGQIAKDIGNSLSLQKQTLLDKHKKTVSNASRFLHFAGTVTTRRGFCVTNQGRMAVVPPYCEEGDIICIIKGAHMPFVLRDIGGKVPKQVYRLVGCCYVHGVMNGERRVEKNQRFVIM